MHQIAVTFIVACLCLAKTSSAVYVTITQDGPAVHGATISFKAELFDDHGVKQTGTKHKFEWRDDAIPPHHFTDEGEFSTSLWNVTYAGSEYSPGQYEVEVKVKRWVGFFYWDITSARVTVNVTVLLNGQMRLVQNGTNLGGSFVSQSQQVIHRIELSPADAAVLSANGTVVNTYWFMGCEYFGSTQDLTFPYNYTKDDVDKVKVVRALVVGGKETENNTIEETGFFGGAGDDNVTDAESTTVRPDHNCEDFPVVPKDPNKFYGYFKRHVIPTAPVHVDQPEGATWLRMGEVLQLNVSCSGSAPYYSCVKLISGDYNVTGNETCPQARLRNTCRVSYTHLINRGTKYTVLFIIGNRVSKTVTPVGITRYSEKHHPQLSVVIVPISCSVVAIVLIIFGVAYYIQSRNRYQIEVADFDFSRNSDTEYKTFKERLRDAVSSAFTRVKDEEYSDDGPSHYSGGGGVWSPTRKNKPPREGNLLYENSDSDQ